MSVTPDPTEPSPPHGGPARLPTFWIVAVFGLVCMVAGYALSRFGPHVFPIKPRPSVSSDLATLRPLAPVQTYPADEPPLLEVASAAPNAEAMQQLAQRIDALEA
ncbi:MAG: hypothetical protein WA047_13180, partial [Phenylobacterium sp.]